MYKGVAPSEGVHAVIKGVGGEKVYADSSVAEQVGKQKWLN